MDLVQEKQQLLKLKTELLENGEEINKQFQAFHQLHAQTSYTLTKLEQCFNLRVAALSKLQQHDAC